MMADNNIDNVPPRKRKITTEEKERAARLKSIYQRKKTDLGLNETRLGEALGITQSGVNKYLNGSVGMSAEKVCKFAKVLGVDPHDIDPEMDNRFRVIAINTKDKLTLSVTGYHSGKFPRRRTVSVIGTRYMPQHTAIVMDTTAFEPMIPEGTRIILDPLKRLKAGQNIVVNFVQANKFVPYHMVARNDDGIEVVAYSIHGGFKPEKTEHPEYFPQEPHFISYDDIGQIYTIIGTDSRPPEYE